VQKTTISTKIALGEFVANNELELNESQTRAVEFLDMSNKWQRKDIEPSVSLSAVNDSAVAAIFSRRRK